MPQSTGRSNGRSFFDDNRNYMQCSQVYVRCNIFDVTLIIALRGTGGKHINKNLACIVRRVEIAQLLFTVASRQRLSLCK
jgi:hypothetical protein